MTFVIFVSVNWKKKSKYVAFLLPPMTAGHREDNLKVQWRVNLASFSLFLQKCFQNQSLPSNHEFYKIADPFNQLHGFTSCRAITGTSTRLSSPTSLSPKSSTIKHQMKFGLLCQVLIGNYFLSPPPDCLSWSHIPSPPSHLHHQDYSTSSVKTFLKDTS